MDVVASTYTYVSVSIELGIVGDWGGSVQETNQHNYYSEFSLFQMQYEAA